MLKRIKMFYEMDCFPNLQETTPFLKYLEEETEKIRESVTGNQVLEIGSGNGRLIPIVAPGRQYFGIEISERLHGQAVLRFGQEENVTLILGDANKLPYPNDTFDYVLFAWNTFGNLYRDKDRVLNEAIRVTKPKGMIILSVLSEEALHPYLEMLKVNRLSVDRIRGNYVFLRDGLISERFSQEKLVSIFKRHKLKFTIESLTEIGFWCECTKGGIRAGAE